MRSASLLFPAILLIPVLLASLPLAAKEAPEIATLTKLDLPDTTGKLHRLEDLKKAKAIVLAYTGPGCPLAELYADRVNRIARDSGPKGVVVLGVNSSPGDTVEGLEAFRREFRLTFPVLRDEDQRLARQLGVTRTTEVLLIRPDGRILYRGSLDDQYTLGKRSMGIRKLAPEKHYLLDALEDHLAGRPVRLSKTEAVGCAITFKKRAAEGTSSSDLTYHRDIEPIFQRRCQSCHRPGEIAPFSLLTFDDADSWATMIEEVVENRRMPPWHAAPDHRGQFANDRSLTEAERQKILDWVAAGSPRGEPEEAPPTVNFPEGWQIGEPDAVFEMEQAQTIPATGQLDYRWARVKTRFEEDRWIQASEVQAGDPAVVHHILVFAVDPENPRRWQRETRGGAHGYFAIMVPGGEPTIYPEGVARRLPAGADLIFQIHYTPSGKETRDRSRIGFRFTDRPSAEVVTRSAVNQVGLIIPPGAEAHEVQANYRFRRDTRLLSLLPHMHLRGQAFRYELLLPASVKVSRPPDFTRLPPTAIHQLDFEAASSKLTGLGKLDDDLFRELRAQYDAPKDRAALEHLAAEARTRLLLDVPLYDFSWQGMYRFREPVLAPRGSRLRCTAVFNNSPSNPALTEKLYSRTVFWGQQTWDEMMIGYFDAIEGPRP